MDFASREPMANEHYPRDFTPDLTPKQIALTSMEPDTPPLGLTAMVNCRARASEIPQLPPLHRRGRSGRAARGSRFQEAYRARRRGGRAPRARGTLAETTPAKATPGGEGLAHRSRSGQNGEMLRPLTLRAARAPPGPPHRLPTRPSPPPRRAASGDPSPAPWSAAGAERRGTPSGQPKPRPNRRPRPPPRSPRSLA